MIRTPLVACLAFSLLGLSQPSAVLASAGDQQMVSNKLNIAGRQRMLSQRMAKAACFVHIDVQKPNHLDMLKGASNLFDTSHTALLKGSDELGLPVETNPRVLNGFGSVESLWRGYKKAVEQGLQAKEVSAGLINIIEVINLPTLKQMHATVNLIEQTYAGDTGRHPSLSAAINLSGAQRMLTQKASKEFCFIEGGIEETLNKKSLEGTVKRFDKVLAGLIKGNQGLGLSPAPTDEIRDQLSKVDSLWQPLKIIFEKAYSGKSLTDAEIIKVATDNNTLLVEMNKAVQMYVKL